MPIAPGDGGERYQRLKAKAIETLQRCAEYGKMLVRGGQLSHPELPRF